MSDFVASRIRTFVPLIVGWAIAQLVGFFGLLESVGINVQIDEGKAAAVVTVAAVGVYYELARRLERRWPRLGWLLGLPKQPTY